MVTTNETQVQESIGAEMYDLAARLYPICRSITGEGVRETLRILKTYIPLHIVEVPTGTSVFDWTVPQEWNIRDAWVKAPNGEKIIDFREHNLHVLNYSVPIHRKMDLESLRPHLFSHPEQPDLIPYRTSYYERNWGFCLPHRQWEALEEGTYEVMIDSSLKDGQLTYGEYYIPGDSEEEILFSAHVCHPSLANDNLSGISLLTLLARALSGRKLRYSYRFLFIPGTIGAITWLARNEARLGRIKGGLVASLVGDTGDFTYKKSRRGDSLIDRAAAHILKHETTAHRILDFFPYGYDERQFCSPGINLAMGNLTRSQYGQYPEYHTSGDNLELIRPEYLAESYRVYHQFVQLLEANTYYLNRHPKGEPQLGRRGLYDAVGGRSDRKIRQMAMLWLLNLSDGEHSLLDIAERAGYPFALVAEVARLLEEKELLSEIKK